MTEQTKQNLIRWGLSSAVTFLSAFIVVILADIDKITPESFRDGSIAGLVFVGLRAGIKAILELSAKYLKKE